VSLLTRAYVRRKRFEARLIAQEVGMLFRDTTGSDPSSLAPPPAPEASVPPSVLLRTLGITI